MKQLNLLQRKKETNGLETNLRSKIDTLTKEIREIREIRTNKKRTTANENWIRIHFSTRTKWLDIKI